MTKFSIAAAALFFCSTFFAQETKNDTIKEREIAQVVIMGKKPTVESRADRTVYNVANSSVLAGNTTWEVLKMAPLISVDNNDLVKAEGESVTVYINDRKSIFSGKDLKEYLKTIPAENLMKIEVITSPSARYEASGPVINIVLKKLENEGLKGSVSVSNTQMDKNSQYISLNINYHKNKFTQSFSGSYIDNTNTYRSQNENLFYNNNYLTRINAESLTGSETPSFSSSSEFELNEKNTIGFIAEVYQSKTNSLANALGITSVDNFFISSYDQNQNSAGQFRNLGNNIFYKYYDKQKDVTLDFDAGINYDATDNSDEFLKKLSAINSPEGYRIAGNNENREYYLKADYARNLGEEKNRLEFGGKIDFKNNAIPSDYFTLNNGIWNLDTARSNDFQYVENLNSLYTNFSKTYFKKLETRIGLRYEYISYKIRQKVNTVETENEYGKLLPNLLLKYSFNDNYNLSATYNKSLWRPYYTEFNPFLMPTNDGTFYQGNTDLQPNPGDRFGLKLSFYKKYFVSANYTFSDQDYWDTYFVENGNTINRPVNFNGKQKRYSVNFNTNQTFFKNKLNVNLNFGFNYYDKSDFYERNNLDLPAYQSDVNGSGNFSYTNLFGKNININGWVGVYTQNSGNSLSNKPNVFHNLSVTKIFDGIGLEATLRFINIFKKPVFDNTTYAPIGEFRTISRPDYYGASFSLVKRFGNQKVKENSKTDVEKESGGGK